MMCKFPANIFKGLYPKRRQCFISPVLSFISTCLHAIFLYRGLQYFMVWIVQIVNLSYSHVLVPWTFSVHVRWFTLRLPSEWTRWPTSYRKPKLPWRLLRRPELHHLSLTAQTVLLCFSKHCTSIRLHMSLDVQHMLLFMFLKASWLEDAKQFSHFCVS